MIALLQLAAETAEEEGSHTAFYIAGAVLAVWAVVVSGLGITSHNFPGNKAGRTAVTVPGDIRDEAHCRTIVERAVAELGGVDILVNNAAFQMAQPGGITDITT